MKIKKLKIDKYKKFKGLELNFKPGINVIVGKNEAGKSTVVKAIMDSLFLNPATKTKDVKETQSWFESALGKISLEFELNHENYSIIKDFEKSTLELIGDDLKTIRTQTEFSKFLKTKIGVGSKELYRNTAFITQREIAVIEDKGDLKDAIQNVSVESDSDVSIQDSIDALEKESKSLTKGSERWVANPGKIPSLINQIEKLKSELLTNKEKIKHQTKDQTALGESKENLKKYNKKLGDLEKLIQENEKIKEAKSKINILNGELDEIDKRIERIKELEKLIQENEEKISTFSLNEIEDDLIGCRKIIEQNNLLSIQKPNNILWQIFLGLGAIAIILEIFLNQNWLLFLGLVFIVLAVVFRFITSKKRITLTSPNAFYEKYNIEKLSDLEHLLNTQKEIHNNLQIFQSEVKGLLRGTSKDLLESTKRDYYKQAERLEINYLSSESLAIELSAEELISKKRELGDLKENLENATGEISYLKGKIQNSEINEEDINDLANKISVLESDLEFYKNKNTVIELTIEALKFAFLNTVKNFKQSATKSIGQNLQLITNQRYSDIKINDDFSIEIFSKEKNDWVDPLNVLSTGTVDQIYFLIRLGFITFISPKESVPIILDDTFVSFDKERLTATEKLLKSLNSDQQILLFSHNDIYEGWGNIIRLD